MDNKFIKAIGIMMQQNPENFLIAPDGKLYYKCRDCKEFHDILSYHDALAPNEPNELGCRCNCHNGFNEKGCKNCNCKDRIWYV